MEILHKRVPKKKLGSWSDAPWMTTDLKRLLRKKKRLYNNCKKSNNPGDKHKYCQFQKHLNEFIWNQIKNFMSPLLISSIHGVLGGGVDGGFKGLEALESEL